MSETILVTGASGFIGCQLARRLSLNPTARVFCVDNFTRGEDDETYRELTNRSNVTRIDLDLTDQTAVRDGLPDKVDRVFHFAALNGTPHFYKQPFKVIQSTTLPTLFLLEKYATAGLKCFFYAGSGESYASTVERFSWEVPTREDVPLCIADPHNPRWSYAASKLIGEIAIHNAHHSFGMPFVVARYHNVYGPRMGAEHLIPQFLMRAKNGLLSIHGHEETRAFIFVEDAIDATLEASRLCLGETVNIGSEEEWRIVDLIQLLMQIAKLQGPLELHPSLPGSVRRRAPNIDKLKKMTNYRQQWSIEDGLRETAKYYLST